MKIPWWGWFFRDWVYLGVNNPQISTRYLNNYLLAVYHYKKQLEMEAQLRLGQDAFIFYISLILQGLLCNKSSDFIDEWIIAVEPKRICLHERLIASALASYLLKEKSRERKNSKTLCVPQISIKNTSDKISLWVSSSIQAPCFQIEVVQYELWSIKRETYLLIYTHCATISFHKTIMESLI